ncbi:aminoacetone oxidase family FAD-binding enzyme, partial [bacterium]|nr:aminoacetone oxidase family FAD-binding enzyme [bacterium]
MKHHYDICIVGGGPAGLMTAIEAAYNGARVVLLEAGPSPGRKLLATGNGRCNLTHAGTIESFLQGFDTRAARFLKPSIYRFTPQDSIAWFESLGVPLKVERGSRVFPLSDRSRDILDVLTGEIRSSGAELRISAPVLVIEKDESGFSVACPGKNLYATAVVVTTGGLSMKRSGSTGDGYRFAEKLGHTVNEPRASLVPLVTSEKWPKEIEGLALKNVRLSAHVGKKRVERFGEML